MRRESIPTKIVKLFEQYPGQILTRTFIFRKCWGQRFHKYDKPTFNTNMHYARGKLKEGRIVYIRPRGYKWVRD